MQDFARIKQASIGINIMESRFCEIWSKKTRGGISRKTRSVKTRHLFCALGFLHQRAKRIDGDTERAASKSVHVGGVDADYFSFDVEDRTATAAVSGGCVVDQFVADQVAEMSL
jgi:hypothetical protein